MGSTEPVNLERNGKHADNHVSSGAGQELRQRFLKVLSGRRAGKVPLSVRVVEDSAPPPVLYYPPPVTTEEDMKDLVKERLFLTTEEGPQGQVPVLIVRPKAAATEKRATVILMHSTNKSKEMMLPFLIRYAKKGYIAVGVDARYHGERADGPNTYFDAMVRGWKEGKDMPFLFDTTWDLVKVLDYLCTREDVDSARIGMAGVSLGGMHTWMTCIADSRVAVAAPMIGVQNFKWAVDNDRWHARVASIPHAFEAARKDMSKEKVDKEVVQAVWNRLCPQLLDEFDCPYSLPALAPRPLLLLNGELDPRCPVAGLQAAVEQTKKLYADAGVEDHFQFVVEPGLGHEPCANFEGATEEWMDKFLKAKL